LLIANAGVFIETTAPSFRADLIEAHLRVNLLGAANSIEAVLPGMIERKRGHLVAISSLASYRGLPRMAGYCASKAGLNAMFDALRYELRPHGIQVTTVCPGWLRTPMTAHVDVPMPHILEPEDAAGRILRAIERGQTFLAFPTPMVFQVRLLRWLPHGLSDWLVHRSLRRLRQDNQRPRSE
jgi:short-subunit dehydrogenase